MKIEYEERCSSCGARREGLSLEWTGKSTRLNTAPPPKGGTRTCIFEGPKCPNCGSYLQIKENESKD